MLNSTSGCVTGVICLYFPVVSLAVFIGGNILVSMSSGESGISGHIISDFP